MKIIADPRFCVHYLSYFIYGIKELGIDFSFDVIDDVPIMNRTQLSKGMPFLTSKGLKVFIDPNDKDDVDDVFYDWCDVYAKVNVKKDDLNREKLRVIGPSFAVRLWNPLSTAIIGVRNFLKARKAKGINNSFVTFIKSYFYLIHRRLYYNEYRKNYKEDEGFVFSMSTLWYDPLTDTTTNRMRGVFAKSCKAMMPKFEGGFYYLDRQDVLKEFPEYKKYLEEYSDILTMKRVGMKKYLKKIKQSVMVFNSPAVCGCHGWKLGEYLALGKAIISMPLSHEMPGDFIPAKHYMLVKNEKEIEGMIKCLMQNRILRDKLKKNASLYFDQYLEPKVVVKRIFRI